VTANTPDPVYRRYQYADAEKLRVRQEAHRLYSEGGDRLTPWLMGHLAPQPGLRLVDVGCGPGTMHADLAAEGISTIIALDVSMGMVREAREAAARTTARVHAIRADAQRLPLPDACCQRVLANYVLYHVPDIPQALREMRRVLRSPGRTLIATNGAGHLVRLHDLHLRAVAETGYVPGRGDGPRFSLEHLELVRAVFPRAERHIYEDALVFPSPEPALAYYASGLIDRVENRSADGSHRARLVPVMRQLIQAIIEREGSFRVPKMTGCFVAQV
jgi:ubiquinone/menaquinone biosynthesis C-methylase UbiE